MVGTKAALQRLAQRGQLLAQLTLGEVVARSASTSGSWVPWRSASSISRPDTPKVSLATLDSLILDSLIPASSSSVWSRCASRVRSWTSALR